jgi:hypothetical protein
MDAAKKKRKAQINKSVAFEAQSDFNYGARARLNRLEFVLRFYSLLGIMIAVFSAGYLLLTLLPYNLSETQKTAVVLVGVGLALAAMSRALIVWRKERDQRDLERLKEQDRIVGFLDAWTKFETAGKDALSRRREKFERHSVRSVISRLRAENKIDDVDMKMLESALEARNLIVHGGRQLPTSFLKETTDVLLSIIKKVIIH